MRVCVCVCVCSSLPLPSSSSACPLSFINSIRNVCVCSLPPSSLNLCVLLLSHSPHLSLPHPFLEFVILRMSSLCVIPRSSLGCLISCLWVCGVSFLPSLPLSLPSLTLLLLFLNFLMEGRQARRRHTHTHTFHLSNKEIKERKRKGKGGREGGRESGCKSIRNLTEIQTVEAN